MVTADPIASQAAELPAGTPLTTIRAYRKNGGAVVIVCRGGRIHRHRVTLRRYAALREWTLSRAARRWKRAAGGTAARSPSRCGARSYDP